ncbi:glycosyltransferase [Cohnella abietis]|uniref:Glycosyl transferase family 1 domain-containing protein n=1 Tax=Cohnella abietis TaxID=2507935 RepID=A0A3T1D5D7_9BACL|nr:hypothetical protein [Cohnella abietis]BBI33320.1 hypothetical protein KCTCHS21_27190 [Cohnella abietis]
MIHSGVAEKIYSDLTYKDCVVSFHHVDYRKTTGGAEKYGVEQQKMMNDRSISYVALFIVTNQDGHKVGSNHLIVEVVIDGKTSCFLAAWQVGFCFSNLISTKKINLMRIFLNGLNMNIAMIDEILSRIKEKEEIETFHILHDYYCLCRNTYLFYNDEQFCGPAPIGSPLCTSCRYGEGREAIYDSINQLFIKHNVVIVSPSENGKRIFLRLFQHLEQNVRVIFHQHVIPSKNSITRFSMDDRNINIAYIGGKNSYKGWNAWVKLNGIANKSDYDFYHFSFADQTLPGTNFVDTSFHNGSKQDTTSRLIEHEIDVVLLWSNWFGNYNYTYYESLAANCLVITYKDSGNIADQTRHFKNGLVLDSEQELVELFNDTEKLKEIVASYKKSNMIYKITVNNELADELMGRRLYLHSEYQSAERQLNNDYEQTIDSLIQVQLELQQKLKVFDQHYKGLETHSNELETRYNESLVHSQQLETLYNELFHKDIENMANIQLLTSQFNEYYGNHLMISKRLAQLEGERFLKTFIRAFYKLIPLRIRLKLKKFFGI